MSGMFVTKLLMTQAITEDGKARAITIMKAEPNVITQIKLPEKAGYFAIQLGLPNAKAKPTKAGIPVMRRKGEFKYSEGEYKVGEKITHGPMGVSHCKQLRGYFFIHFIF